MNLLVTGAWAQARDHLRELETLGHSVRFLQQEKDSLPCDPAWVEGVVCNGLFLHHPMEQFPNLRWIHLTSAGFDRVNLDEIRARGIALYNARGVYSVPMAEFALCGVLQLYKQSRFFAQNQQAHRWEKRRDLLELRGKTVTVLGCGSVGSACAKLFGSMGCRVWGADLYPREDPLYERMLPISRLEELLPETDVLILCVPLGKDSLGLMDRRRIGLLPSGAVLVNISRGPVLEAAALLEALRQGRLLGAVLDVFQQEPLPAEDPLWEEPGVILTPHNSFVGDGNGRRLSSLILEQLRKAAPGAERTE